jgi:hypothetical protein
MLLAISQKEPWEMKLSMNVHAIGQERTDK